jgi:hypothetical protein
MRKKLTKEVFQRDDCPKWAKWAAVDSDGTAYWYEKKPIPENYGTLGVLYHGPKKCMWMCINGKFSLDVTLIARKQTNLEWLCEHPDELAERLIRRSSLQKEAPWDLLLSRWIAPDGTEFACYDPTTAELFDIDKTKERCYDYTVNWLKQEHKENNDDQKQS